MTLEDQIKAAAGNIAVSHLVDAMSQPDREAILRAALQRSFESWEFRAEVDKQIQRLTAEVIARESERPEYREMIRAAVHVAFEQACHKLNEVLPAVLLEAVAGSTDRNAYVGPSILRQHLGNK